MSNGNENTNNNNSESFNSSFELVRSAKLGKDCVYVRIFVDSEWVTFDRVTCYKIPVWAVEAGVAPTARKLRNLPFEGEITGSGRLAPLLWVKEQICSFYESPISGSLPIYVGAQYNCPRRLSAYRVLCKSGFEKWPRGYFRWREGGVDLSSALEKV